MTKGELIRMWADFPDNTVLGVEGPQGHPVDIVDIDNGFVTSGGGTRPVLIFQLEGDE